MEATWWVVFGISVVVHVILACMVLPKIFFKTEYVISASLDRGLQTFHETDGRTIVYEPRKEYLPYVSQYILSQRGEKKALICKVNEDITYLDYDVVLFGANDKVFHILNIKESIKKAGVTEIAEIPPETAYAALIVNEANDKKIEGGPVKKIRNKGLFLFSAANAFLILVNLFLVKLCFANLFGDVFTESYLADVAQVFLTLGIGLGAACVSFLIAALYVWIRNKRKGERAR